MKTILLLSITFLLGINTYSQNSTYSDLVNRTETKQDGKEHKKYYESGKLKWKGFYLEGKKTGEWTGYFENGNLWYVGNYIEGKKTGTWKINYENGEIRKI